MVGRGGGTARQWWGLAGFAAAVLLVALLGGLGAGGAAVEYQSLRRPAWAPPAWLFGPVWTVLYAMIALSGWLAWRAAGWGWPLTVYALQLGFNAIWTPLFFGAGAYGLALLDIAVLAVLIPLTIVLFWRVSRAAAGLLVPYWAWVLLATGLTVEIWRGN